ncbi:MAG: ABC transporter substrate-binding protein [Peptococcaceae bacterium]
MQKNSKIIALIIVLIFILALTPGCSKKQEEQAEPVTILKIGILPVEDTMPFLVGDQKGFFAEQKIKVELVPFQSAVEKESALQSGQLDGVITDLIVAALLKASGLDIKITTLTSGVTPAEGRFAILTAPGKEVDSLQELQGKKIGITNNTIIEYVTDGLLQEAGISPRQVEKVVVPKLPVRLEMLLNGQVDAATLPDPLAAFAEFQGAKVFGDNTARANLSQVVLVMLNESIREKSTALKNFFSAYSKAVEEYNRDPEAYRSLLVEQAKVPEPIQAEYKLPLFPLPRLPQEKEVNDVLTWLQEKDLLKNNITYPDLIAEGLY